MNKKEKQKALETLAEQLTKSPISLFTGFKGLSTPELYEARKKMKAEKTHFKVIKKTLLKKALDQMGIQAPSSDFWKGEVATLTCSNGDPVRVTKLLADWVTQNQKVFIKGGILERSKWLDQKTISAMSKLPGAQELRGQVVGTLAGPLINLVGVMQATIAQVILVLRVIEENSKKSGANPAS